MSVMILDAGNSIIKAKISRRERGEAAFAHAIKQLTEAEYSNVVSRAGAGGLPPGYLRTNRKPYVAGESAERHGVHIQRMGAARYTRDYYGNFSAAALARLYKRGGEIMIFCSHPPGDVLFRQDLMKAIIGDWQIETNGSERCFRVTYPNTFVIRMKGRHIPRLSNIYSTLHKFATTIETVCEMFVFLCR
jgi:hypothetical protein